MQWDFHFAILVSVQRKQYRFLQTGLWITNERPTSVGLGRNEHRMILGLTLWTWPYLQDDATATCDTP